MQKTAQVWKKKNTTLIYTLIMENKLKMISKKKVILGIFIILMIACIIYCIIIKRLDILVAPIIGAVIALYPAIFLPDKRPAEPEPSLPHWEVEARPTDMPINNIPSRFQYFTGREKTLTDIHEKFNATLLGSQIHVLVITGMGGIGKSEIAKEYAFRFRKEYDCIWWIDAETEERIRSAYLSFAEKFNLDQDKEANKIRDRVIGWMKNHDRWFFVFDNAENEASIKEYLPQSNTGNILITSRFTQWEKFEFHPIEDFSSQESCNFLKEYTKQKQNTEKLEDLVIELGCLPLALKHAGAYMRNTKTSYAAYLDSFHNKNKKSKPSTEGVESAKTIVANTLDKSFQLIRKRESRQLIYLCAFMAPEKINGQWFVEASEKLPKPLRKAAKEELNEVIANLTAYSLIIKDEDGNLNIHRLVQDIIRDSLKVKQTQWRNYCTNIMNELLYYDFSTAKSRTLFLILSSHILAITNGINDEGATKETANLYHFLGYGFNAFADYDQALMFYEKALRIYEKKVLGKIYPVTARTYNNMAAVYDNKGDYVKALVFYEKALKIFEKVLGKEHPLTSTCYDNMGTVYINKGDYEKALVFYEKALKIREKVLGKEHPDTASTYNNMASIYYYKGDYVNALEFNEIALLIREKVLGKEHPSTATCYDNMGTVYINKGDYVKALEFYEIALLIREKVLGKEHPSTSNTYIGIANVYYHKGDYEKALVLYEKALLIQEKVLGKEHPSTATTYNNMAFIYSHKGSYEKALEFYKKAFKIREKVLGKEHPKTKAVFDDMFNTYKRSGKSEPFDEWLNE